MRYFENFQVGDTFVLGSLKVAEEDIIAFAKQFDPQPFQQNLRLRMLPASRHEEEAGLPCLGLGMGNSLLVLRYEIA